MRAVFSGPNTQTSLNKSNKKLKEINKIEFSKSLLILKIIENLLL